MANNMEHGEIVVKYVSEETPSDNKSLAQTSRAFARVCDTLGQVPMPMFAPVLNQVTLGLMGLQSLHTLAQTPIEMIFAAGRLLEASAINSFVCFDLINKNTCVDILINVIKFEGKNTFLHKAVLNYFLGELQMDQANVTLNVESNVRRLRWEVSQIVGEDHSLTRMIKLPSTCKFCNKTMHAMKHLDRDNKVVALPCCYSTAHLTCLARMYAVKWGGCPYCKVPYLAGRMETVGNLGQILQVKLIRTKGNPPESYVQQGEVFRFLQQPNTQKAVNIKL